MKTDLSGRAALVTGAAGGIGRVIAGVLAENGAAIIVADIDGNGARETAAELPQAIAVEMDIRDVEAIERGVSAGVEAFGAIDILVNNAGVNTLEHRVDIDAFPLDEWRRIVGVDLDGTYLVSRAVAPGMIRHGAGRIVNIASTVGLAAMRLQSPFVAAKAGIIHLTRSMALELAPKGIIVNAVAPGSTLTAVTKQLFYAEDGSFHDRTAAFMKHVPLERPGEPEEIAQGVLFLAAPETSFVNGHCLTIDGGWTAGYMM